MQSLHRVNRGRPASAPRCRQSPRQGEDNGKITTGAFALHGETRDDLGMCRRAERRVVALASDQEVDAEIITYLNRLSDYLFVLARYLVKLNGGEEVKWDSGS